MERLSITVLMMLISDKSQLRGNIEQIRVSNTGNPGNLLELFLLLEILEISWKFAKSPGNFLAEFVCLLLL